MRLHIISDLHQEFGEVRRPRVERDCVVSAEFVIYLDGIALRRWSLRASDSQI